MNQDKTLSSWEDAVVWLKQQPEQQALVKACFYDDPLSEAAARYWESTEWQAVRKHLPKHPGKALDIGAGMGIASYALARDGWKVAALEPDASSIVGAGAIRRLASETTLGIEVVETWGERLPFDDSVFDVVHCRQVLHHARDLRQLCKEIGRVLKQGGKLIATREHVISSKGDLIKFLDSHPLHKLYGGENAFLLQQYIAAIKDGGIFLKHVLNPNQSDINAYPETIAQVRWRVARRLRIPIPELIPDLFLSWLGARDNTPGRLYSFIGIKK